MFFLQNPTTKQEGEEELSGGEEYKEVVDLGGLVKWRREKIVCVFDSSDLPKAKTPKTKKPRILILRFRA